MRLKIVPWVSLPLIRQAHTHHLSSFSPFSFGFINTRLIWFQTQSDVSVSSENRVFVSIKISVESHILTASTRLCHSCLNSLLVFWLEALFFHSILHIHAWLMSPKHSYYQNYYCLCLKMFRDEKKNVQGCLNLCHGTGLFYL